MVNLLTLQIVERTVSLDISAALLILNSILIGVVGWFLNDFMRAQKIHAAELQSLKEWKKGTEKVLENLGRDLEKQTASIERIQQNTHSTELLLRELHTLIKKT